MKALILALAILFMPSLAAAEQAPATDVVCDAPSAGVLENAILTRATWTQHVRSRTGQQHQKKITIRANLANAIDVNWSCLTWQAELIVPANGCFERISGTAKQTLARDATAAWTLNVDYGPTEACDDENTRHINEYTTRTAIIVQIHNRRSSAGTFVSRVRETGTEYVLPVSIEATAY